MNKISPNLILVLKFLLWIPLMLATLSILITVIKSDFSGEETSKHSLSDAFTRAEDIALDRCKKDKTTICADLKLVDVEEAVCENMGPTDSGRECGYWSFAFTAPKIKHNADKYPRSGVDITIGYSGEVSDVSDIYYGLDDRLSHDKEPDHQPAKAR